MIPLVSSYRVARAPDMQTFSISLIVGVSADARLADLHTRDPLLFVFLRRCFRSTTG